MGLAGVKYQRQLVLFYERQGLFGGNDVAMLEVADFPIIIPGDKRTITVNNTNAVTADFKGPKGWNQILLPLLQQLIKENCGG